MPTLSSFFGIVVSMYWNDHQPPHFHARYADSEVVIRLETLEVEAGHLPRRAMGRRTQGGTLGKLGAGPEPAAYPPHPSAGVADPTILQLTGAWVKESIKRINKRRTIPFLYRWRSLPPACTSAIQILAREFSVTATITSK
jgi:hypothetical protein